MAEYKKLALVPFIADILESDSDESEDDTEHVLGHRSKSLLTAFHIEFILFPLSRSSSYLVYVVMSSFVRLSFQKNLFSVVDSSSSSSSRLTFHPGWHSC